MNKIILGVVGMAFISFLFLLSPFVIGAEEKNDPTTGFTIFFTYNERAIDSGNSKLYSSPLGNIYTTDKTIDCTGALKEYKGQTFTFCNINIRFYDGFNQLGDYQFSEKCYGTWSGYLSTTCSAGFLGSTKWVAYVSALYSPSFFIVDGVVEEMNGLKVNRLNDETVTLGYTDKLSNDHVVSTFVTKQNVALQDGTFEFSVPDNLRNEKLWLSVAKNGYFTTYKYFNATLFQNTFTLVLEPESSNPNLCKGDVIYGQDKSGKEGTVCCIDGKVSIPPLYDNQLGTKGLLCKDVIPNPEICNGMDDNNNGRVDEGCPPSISPMVGFLLFLVGVFLFIRRK